ncbi:hypothetical protein Acsp07_30890 [Actinomycetospora sp. NBRC 106378]|nr:hypothetical protein Acsp07_30890 [Actinomycetospora sp. NBRC 106378]
MFGPNGAGQVPQASYSAGNGAVVEALSLVADRASVRRGTAAVLAMLTRSSGITLLASVVLTVVDQSAPGPGPRSAPAKDVAAASLAGAQGARLRVAPRRR